MLRLLRVTLKMPVIALDANPPSTHQQPRHLHALHNPTRPLRPLVPFLLIFALSLMAGVRRSRTIARPIELGYAAFLSLCESKTAAASMTDMRISLSSRSIASVEMLWKTGHLRSGTGLQLLDSWTAVTTVRCKKVSAIIRVRQR